jgi:hypothetical protein
MHDSYGNSLSSIAARQVRAGAGTAVQPSIHPNAPGVCATVAIPAHIPKNLLTRPESSVTVGPMSHRNSARSMIAASRIFPVSGLVRARQIAILVLVLVLLITNGGAG